MPRGSAGTGEPRYVAYLPFTLPPWQVLHIENGNVGEVTRELDGRSVTLKRVEDCYELRSGPFPSEAVADQELNRLRAALLFASLTRQIGIQYPVETGSVTLVDPPCPLKVDYLVEMTGWSEFDGHYGGNAALLIPEHKRLLRADVGKPTVTAGIGLEPFYANLQEALSIPNLGDVVTNKKLKLAIELYASHRFELSRNARFIALVTCLEAVLPIVEIVPIANDVLNSTLIIAKKALSAYKPGTQAYVELDRLCSRFKGMKDESIGMSLRRYVVSVVDRAPTLGVSSEIERTLRDAYNTRSKLLHDGVVVESIDVHFNFLSDFVPKFLHVLFEEATGVRPTPPPFKQPEIAL